MFSAPAKPTLMKALMKLSVSGNLKPAHIMKKLIILLLALSAIFSCQKNEVYAPVEDNRDIVYASAGEMTATRTTLDTNKDVLWSFDDRIAIFKKTTLGLQYRLIDEYSGRNYGGFSRVNSDGDNVYAGNEIKHWVAYYPYQSNIGIKADDIEKPTGYTLTSIDLPQNQYYLQGSFSNGSFPMVALSEDNNITFKNVCGGIKFLFTGTKTIQKISIAGKNKEQLAGTASVLAYVYGKDPVVTVTKGVYDVYLNCGNGVQLDAKKATEFIISLPPVTFTRGFTVTITYTDGTTETVGTDKENVIYRSKLTVMPEISLGDQYTPVTSVTLNMSTINARVGDVILINATVLPDNATNNSVTWSSNNKGVATVDAAGRVTAVAEGTAIITATADKVSATCEVSVAPAPSITMNKYIDEYGISHGTGVLIGNTVWAPVNCGYHATDYPYGKLYQWGRKYGQGYSLEYDSTTPEIAEGPVEISTANDPSNSNKFYLDKEWPYDWALTPNDNLWNLGTEKAPQKNTEYDPCPEGWRVPTETELDILTENHSSWTTNSDNQNGYYFTGEYTYFDAAAKVFFPAAGSRESTLSGQISSRSEFGAYWSSYPSTYGLSGVPNLAFNSNSSGAWFNNLGRSDGYSVRCVQL